MSDRYEITEEGVLVPRKPDRKLRRGIELRPSQTRKGWFVWRTVGRPITVAKILKFDRRAISRVLESYNEPGIIDSFVTIAATETAGRRKLWRREPDGRTSYGIYQFLGTTAAHWAGAKVTATQLYSVEFSTILAFRNIIDTAAIHEYDPIRLCAMWNAGLRRGRLRTSTRNPWGYIVHKDHLDRAAAWDGDIKELIRLGKLRGL